MTALSIAEETLSKIIDGKGFGVESKPLIVGISGPQGSGKSFLGANLVKLLSNRYSDLTIILILTDDFYYPYERQLEISKHAEQDDNKLLVGRGLPGTHDLPLLMECLNDLISKQSPVYIPKYNKGLHNGMGDRENDKNKWNIQKKAPSIVIVEGWFNGYKLLSQEQVVLRYLTSDASSNLKRFKMYQIQDINEKLRAYEEIWSLFDVFVFFDTDSVNNVIKWRIEQEHELIERTGNGMSDSGVINFVKRYMPVYELFYVDMCKHGLEGKINLRISIDENWKVIRSDLF